MRGEHGQALRYHGEDVHPAWTGGSADARMEDLGLGWFSEGSLKSS